TNCGKSGRAGKNFTRVSGSGLEAGRNVSSMRQTFLRTRGEMKCEYFMGWQLFALRHSCFQRAV
ncbi:MAG TPA: hypothetical protein DHU81_00405, partial [Hyphomonas sp.]|nr:hypothetical protein [Hyphomonas sp.]